jgi:FixJ family two-component response regulator
MPSKAPRITIVEDDPSMALATERILRAGGFVSVVFDSAEAALAAGPIQTACLVLDISLPGMSGFDLYHRLTDAGEELPVIFITAHDEMSVRQEAERLGAKFFLSKPFSGRQLLECVKQSIWVSTTHKQTEPL